jgi:4-amino-4-deoxy-L-arabinose transferase-like glycosyltransferase
MPHRFQELIESRSVSPTLNRRHSASVFGIALAMRLLVIWTVLKHYPPQWLFTRGIEMGLLAKSVLAGQGLSSPFGGSTGPTAFIAPIYPLLIALVFKIFGTFTTASAIAVMLVQTALNLLTICLIMIIARRLFNQAAATVAGLIWACSLPLIWMPTIFWETSLSCCLLMGLFTIVLRWSDLPMLAPARWIGLGAYCGFAALVNPALLPSLVAVSLWLVYKTQRKAAWQPMLAVLTFALVFSPWPIRNARIFHAFIPLRTTVGFELWMGNHVGSDGFLNESLFPMYNLAELTDYQARGEIAYSSHKSSLAKEYVYTHPAAFIRMTMIRTKRFWTGTGSRNGSSLFAIHAIFTSLFGFAGLWLIAKSKRYALAILFALPMALFPLPYLIAHAEFRYRLVLDPLLTLLAGYSVTELCKHLIRSSNEAPGYKASLTSTARTV